MIRLRVTTFTNPIKLINNIITCLVYSVPHVLILVATLKKTGSHHQKRKSEYLNESFLVAAHQRLKGNLFDFLLPRQKSKHSETYFKTDKKDKSTRIQNTSDAINSNSLSII